MATPSSDTPCGCGHPHLAHQHYRKGTDCALCACQRFAAAAGVRRLGFRLRRPRSAAA